MKQTEAISLSCSNTDKGSKPDSSAEKPRLLTSLSSKISKLIKTKPGKDLISNSNKRNFLHKKGNFISINSIKVPIGECVYLHQSCELKKKINYKTKINSLNSVYFD